MSPGRPSESQKMPDTQRILINLAKFPASQDSESFLLEAGKRLVLRPAAAGVPVVVVGEKAKAMFFVIRGRLKVTSEDGEATFAELGSGSIFGEIGAMFGVSRTASVVTTTSCVLGVLRSRDLNELLETHESVKEFLLRQVERRLHGLKLDYKTLMASKNKDGTSDSQESLGNNQSSTNESVDSDIEYNSGSSNAQNYMSSSIGRRASSQIPGIELSLVTETSCNTTANKSFSPLSPLTSTSPCSENSYIDALVPCSKIATRHTGSGGLDFQLKAFTQAQQQDPTGPIPGRRRSKIAKSAILQTQEEEQEEQQALTPPSSLPELEKPRRASLFIRPDQLPSHLASRIQQNADNDKEKETDSEVQRKQQESDESSTIPQPSVQTVNLQSLPDVTNIPTIKSILSVKTLSVTESTDGSDEFANSRYGSLGKSPISRIIKLLPVLSVFEARALSKSIYALILDPKNAILSTVNLSPFSRWATDKLLLSILAVGRESVRELDLRNCCFITSSGLMLTASLCPNIQVLSLSNMWNTADATIISIVDSLTNITELDLSNIRTISYTTILHILSVLSNLKTLVMSYCKSVTALALNTPHWAHLSKVNFQRCTGISSVGFHSWYTITTNNNVESLLSTNEADWLPTKMLYDWQLKELILSDCTFLEDLALMSVVSICPLLERLSLSFCCSLSETCVVHMSKVCKNLRFLDLSFCGEAVTDSSLACISSIKTLEGLCIRGCTQVTPKGMLSVVSNAKYLRYVGFKNCLDPKLESGVIEYIEKNLPHITFLTQGHTLEDVY